MFRVETPFFCDSKAYTVLFIFYFLFFLLFIYLLILFVYFFFIIIIIFFFVLLRVSSLCITIFSVCVVITFSVNLYHFVLTTLRFMKYRCFRVLIFVIACFWTVTKHALSLKSCRNNDRSKGFLFTRKTKARKHKCKMSDLLDKIILFFSS